MSKATGGSRGHKFRQFTVWTGLLSGPLTPDGRGKICTAKGLSKCCIYTIIKYRLSNCFMFEVNRTLVNYPNTNVCSDCCFMHNRQSTTEQAWNEYKIWAIYSSWDWKIHPLTEKNYKRNVQHRNLHRRRFGKEYYNEPTKNAFVK